MSSLSFYKEVFMLKYYDNINTITDEFIAKLNKLKNAVNKFNDYLSKFTEKSIFKTTLTAEEQKSIKISFCNLCLFIDSLHFSDTIGDISQLIITLTEKCTEPHSTDIDRCLCMLNKLFDLYILADSKTLHGYIENSYSLDINEFISKGNNIIVVFDNIIKELKS